MYKKFITNTLLSASVLIQTMSFVQAKEKPVIMDIAPKYSPNGDLIVYYSYRGKTLPDIFISKADGTEERRLTVNTNLWDIEPTWSADGQYVYYRSGINMKSLNMYKISAKGGTPKQQTFAPKGKGIDGYSVDSKDQRIVYSINSSSGSADLMLTPIDANNKAQPQTVFSSQNKAKHIRSPKWHPKLDLIVFTSDRNERKDDDLFLYNLKTKSLKQLTDVKGDVMMPDWSSKGDFVLFASPLGGKKPDIFRVNIDGSAIENLTKNSNAMQHFADTSSDDSKLLFESGNWKDGFKIFSMDINGKNLKQLTKRL
ncbi:TolB family protein [Pseudoalteromonas denitrificans]|uniref:WD40-like Beta Propeller Repeat n=1 Tax=Pseudoalteromonas denitrificans DSM 6059 TaxID=1123010 RepID=A0A1I1KFR8_9GAMM|nr:PD40 domain-containing protein [Pseudoalteromonas denitrificans]SFC57568.1 WD40-like Beta Propeller Repeat [Pseudoalteromonas denitrificans DSM 6059]